MCMMTAVWQGVTSSGMALVAVNALLLSALSCQTAAAAGSASASAASNGQTTGPGGHMITLGRSVAAVPHSSLAAAGAPRRLSIRKGRRIDRHCRHGKEDGDGEKKRSAIDRLFIFSRRGEPRDTESATSTSTSNRNDRSCRGTGQIVLPMWVHSRRVTPPKQHSLWPRVSEVREALASSAGSKTASRRQKQQTQQEEGWGWKQLLRNRDACSSKAKGERHGSASTKSAAMISTAVETPSTPAKPLPSTKAAAAPMAAAAGGAVALAKSDEEPSPSPVPSYLQWSDVTPDTAEPIDQGENTRFRKLAQSLGRGSRGGRADSGGEAEASSNQGTLGAAKSSRGGAGTVSLTFKEAMFAGAVSRSVAQTCMQPANVIKTLLQGRGTSSQLSNLSFKLLTRGAGAQFVLSMPHGAFNFATLEVILGCSAKVFPAEWREKAGPVLDFFSSSVATLVCSVVSTPQMVITDRIMAGMYPNLVSGVREISRTEGLRGFYTGWSANVAQKIPSYGLTWVFFQQFKRLHRKATDRPPTNTENFVLGAAAAGATVCIMIPLDTVKTRLVTQTAQPGVVPYRGVLPTLSRVVREEGLGPIYRSLTPRLMSVVPMIGIQFGIYEFVRKELMSRKEEEEHTRRSWLPPVVRRTFGMDGELGRQQPEYVKDFLRNVYLLEEELV